MRAGGSSKIASEGLAVAWLASTIAIRVPGAPIVAGAGFVGSVAITGATLAVWALIAPRELLAALRANRALVGAAGLVLAAHVVSAAAAGAPAAALVGCARVAAIGVFAIATVSAQRGGGLEAAFGWAAVALLSLFAVLFAVGATLPALRPYVFLSGLHQQLAQLPRFAALTGIPGSTGAWALLAVGLAGTVRPPWLRRAARIVGVLVTVATFSIATLALPAVLVAALRKRGRGRAWITSVLAILAVVPLYVHVLTIECAGKEITVSPLHPAYEESGLGPAQMPIHEACLLGTRTRFHFTMYAALVVRAGTCFADHPFTGVGPREFEEACPVVTMNTYGDWTAQRRPHNQWTELLVELGLVGLALGGAAVWLVWRRTRWEPPDRWYAAAALGILVCSFSGDLLVSLPAVGFFATQLRPRDGSAR